MRSNARKNVRRGALTGPVTVRVDLNGRGETLDDARRVAYLCVAHMRPCELIVCDAYHRVVHHEFINGHGPAGTGGRTPRSWAGG